jgi:mitochondrial chaperone BCS1
VGRADLNSKQQLAQEVPQTHLSSSYRSADDDDWDQWEVAVSGNTANIEGGPGEDGEGRPKTRVVFQPTYGTTHTIFYNGHSLRVIRDVVYKVPFSILSCRPADALFHQCRCTFQCYSQTTILQAKKEYEAEAIHRIQIYFADAQRSWFMALD